MTPELIIQILTPVIVFIVTAVVNKVGMYIPGIWIVGVVVPILSLGVAWITTLLVPGLAFWQLVGFNLAAVFINELLRQITKTKNNE